MTEPTKLTATAPVQWRDRIQFEVSFKYDPTRDTLTDILRDATETLVEHVTRRYMEHEGGRLANGWTRHADGTWAPSEAETQRGEEARRRFFQTQAYEALKLAHPESPDLWIAAYGIPSGRRAASPPAEPSTGHSTNEGR